MRQRVFDFQLRRIAHMYKAVQLDNVVMIFKEF